MLRYQKATTKDIELLTKTRITVLRAANKLSDDIDMSEVEKEDVYKRQQHQNTSGQDMSYFDDEKKEKYIPYVIEPSLGADRVVLAFLCAAYDEENIGTEEKPDMRTVLHFHPALAPVKIGVLPLSKKLNEGAEKVFTQLSKKYN